MQCHSPGLCSVFNSGHIHVTESMVIEMLINLSQNTFFLGDFLFWFFLKYDPRLGRPNMVVKNKCAITVFLNFLNDLVVVSWEYFFCIIGIDFGIFCSY